jgi:hypothetical protein
MRRNKASLNHGSVYARQPQRAAEALAQLSDGLARPFGPCEGAWVCFLGAADEDWDGPFIELYPHTAVLVAGDGGARFAKSTRAPQGAGTHFNITVQKTRGELEAACEKSGLACAWRQWQGLLEVWLEDELLIECVPTTE